MTEQQGPGERPSPGRADDGASDWIFARPDPGTHATEPLPDAAELDGLAARRRSSAPLPPRGRSRHMAHTDEIRVPDGLAEQAAATGSGSSSYARSGTTPNDDEVVIRGIALPERFATLSWWDAVRDVVALVCLAGAYTTAFTVADIGAWAILPRAVIGLSLLSLLAALLLRWVPRTPRPALIRGVRSIGQVPTVIVALALIAADLVLSLPVLFAPLPAGPPLGVGVGVSLMLVGSLLALEPRAHEGFLPGARARAVTRRGLLAIFWTSAALFALSVVMVIGRILTTGWAFSVLTLGSSLVSALVLGMVLSSGLRRERSRYVFSVAAVSGLVIGAVCDNSLGLAFARPQSAATGFVYLPFLFAAFALMVSRSFVRTMPLSFRRADWIVYAVRGFEFSILLHAGAALWCVLAALAAMGGVGRGGPVLLLVDAALAALFLAASLYARRSLLGRPADVARASAVGAGLVMVVVGFLDVIVNSLATGAGAGLATGGVALAIGIATSLMLTVPAPVRDEYGAPDLTRMYEDFRRRDDARLSLFARVPDVGRERSRRKSFPGR